MNNDIGLMEMKDLRQVFASISRGTVYSWLNENSPSHIPSFPKPLKIGGKNFWKIKDIKRFIDSFDVEVAGE